ncbi:hypothetical protein BDW62DRAFT_58426 [Aspergillus aurantiobrunneus]
MDFTANLRPSRLMLDRVLEGRPMAARSSRLLNLPVEILTLIIEYLDSDRKTLACLALVNSDCRQLARSCQFKNVVFNYSPKSIGLLSALQAEAVERSWTRDRLTSRASIGVCIRCIETCLDYYWRVFNETRPKDPDDEGNPGSTDGDDYRLRLEQWTESLKTIQDEMQNVHDPGLASVIPTLPHLETISLMNNGTLNSHLLNHLADSTVKHLRLDADVESESTVVQMGKRASWPLESLDIQVDWECDSDSEDDPSDPSAFWNSILQPCSFTLRSLNVSQRRPFGWNEKTLCTTAEFPCLMSLQIGFRTRVCRSAMRSLLRSELLSTLVIDMEDPIASECLEQMGYRESLQKLVWSGFYIPATASLQFLQNNPQLTAFGTSDCVPAALMDRMIPVLGTFPKLKTLSLQWEGTMASSLATISSLTTLEELHISCRTKSWPRSNWFIDHEATQKQLCTLLNLRKLAFSRDEYQFENDLIADGVDFLPDDRERRQEELHCQHMILYAEQYALTFNKLEWIHLGQLSFSITQDGPGRKGVAVPLCKERDANFSSGSFNI